MAIGNVTLLFKTCLFQLKLKSKKSSVSQISETINGLYHKPANSFRTTIQVCSLSHRYTMTGSPKKLSWDKWKTGG